MKEAMASSNRTAVMEDVSSAIFVVKQYLFEMNWKNGAV